MISLSAKDETSRSASTGGTSADRLSREASTHFAIEFPLPSGSIRSPVTALKSLNLTQAVLDGLAVVFWFLFFAALIGSLPLAIGLMIFAKFH
jgi:hypothetical protein